MHAQHCVHSKKGNVDRLRSPRVRQCTEKDRVRFLTLRYWVKSSTRVFLRWYTQSRVIAGYPQTLNARNFQRHNNRHVAACGTHGKCLSMSLRFEHGPFCVPDQSVNH